MPTLKAQTQTPKIRLPAPHAGQRHVLEERKRFTFLSAGRRWRKTSGTMCHVAIPAALDGQRIIWAAPTTDQSGVAWDECMKAVGASGLVRFNKTERTAFFPRDGRIIFRSMDDPNTARGHTADGVVVDEAATVPELAWYEVLRPMLLDTRGWGFVQGTPDGRNWFWREWQGAKDRPDSAAFHAPSLGVRINPETQELERFPHPLENPDITFDEMVQIWATTPEKAFRQEYLAEFSEDGGGVFRGVDDIAIGQLREPYRGWFGIGADLARVNDFTVLTVMDLATKEVVGWERFNQVDWTTQHSRMQTLHLKWGGTHSEKSPVRWMVERNMTGDVLIEQLQRSGVPVIGFSTNQKTKRSLIEDLALAIERKKLKIPAIHTLIEELKAYEQARLKSGVMSFSAPDGLHDDCVISLALAWRLAKFGVGAGESRDFRFVTNASSRAKGLPNLIELYRKQLRSTRNRVISNG